MVEVDLAHLYLRGILGDHDALTGPVVSGVAAPHLDAVRNEHHLSVTFAHDHFDGTRRLRGVAGLARGRTDLLAWMTRDRLHEPYRATVFPELTPLVEGARGAGAIGACLSGSGSTVIAFADSVATMTRIEAAFLAAAGDADLAGRVEIVPPRNAGATVTEES